jgi:hypothetical protein
MPRSPSPVAAQVLEILEEGTMPDLTTRRSRFALTWRAHCKGEARAATLDVE